jgi:hypothetical protein
MAATVEHRMTDRPTIPRPMESPAPAVGGFVAVNGRTSPDINQTEKRIPNGYQSSPDRDSSDSPASPMLPEIRVGQRMSDPQPQPTPVDRPSHVNGRFEESVTASPAKRKRTESPEDASDVSSNSGGSVQESVSAKRQMHAFGPPLEHSSPRSHPQESTISASPTSIEGHSLPQTNGHIGPSSPSQRNGDERREMEQNEASRPQPIETQVSDLPNRPRDGVVVAQSPTQAQSTMPTETSTGQNGSPNGIPTERKQPPRKRMFSHRTKSGCITCRRRKKKCDERKPECNNCLRGSFTCEGYPPPNTYSKHHANKPPLPLQSKQPSTYHM